MTTHGEDRAHRECRVRVRLGEHLRFAYRSEPVAAERYARAMRQYFPGSWVAIDDIVTPGLRRLPGELLWSVAS